MKYGDWYKEPDDLSDPPDDWYTAVWSRFGGRPWTYIIRDAWHHWVIVWIFGLVFLGIIIGHLAWRD